MESKKLPLGFKIKQINNVYEKDLTERLKIIGITSSQCAVLDFLFHTNKDEVNQIDVEKGLNLKNPTVTGLLKRLDEKGFSFLCAQQYRPPQKKDLPDGKGIRYPEKNGSGPAKSGQSFDQRNDEA